MRDISALPSVIKELEQSIKLGIEQAQVEMSQELRNEVYTRAKPPSEITLFLTEDNHNNVVKFAKYKESIKPTPVKWIDSNTCCGGAKSAYNVFWMKYRKVVPYGLFIEWGTGQLGLTTVSTPFVTTEFQYSYKPWDMATIKQLKEYGAFGLSAHPHWYPSARAYAPKVSKKLRSKIMENINGHTT